MSEDILPINWIKTTLNEISFKITDGSHNPPPKQLTGLPMLSAQNILNNEIVFDSYRLINEKQFEEEYKRANVEVNDVLLTIVGTIGRATIVPPKTPKFTLQRSVALIKPVIVNPKWLTFYLQSRICQNFFTSEEKGTAQKGVYLGSLKIIPVNLPPLPEQHRVVAKIEDLFSSLDKGIESLKTAEQQLEIYRQAVLGKAFEGAFTTNWRREHSNANANKEFETIKEIREEFYTQKIEEWTLACEQAKVKSTKKPAKPKKPYAGEPISEEEKANFDVIDKSWALVRFIDLIKYEEDAIKRGPFGSAIKKSFFVPSGYKVYELHIPD